MTARASQKPGPWPAPAANDKIRARLDRGPYSQPVLSGR